MNNKGQSLVLFILIIPILIGIMALVIDCGKVLYTKSKQENTIELILEYTKEDLKNNTLEEEKVKKLIDKNLENNKNIITIEKEKVSILTKEEVEGIFSKILGFKEFKVETKIISYLDNNKVKIEKIK